MLGAVYMILAAALLAGVSGLAKYLAEQQVAPIQIAFLRSLFAAIAMTPFLIQPIRRNGFAWLKPKRPFLMAFRGLSSAMGVWIWMTAISKLTLSELTAITFTAPLFATAGSALILGETVRLRRWIAVTVGFIGVLIIVRPGIVPTPEGMLWAIAAALFMAMAALLIKFLTRTDPSERIVFWTNIGLTVGTLIPAIVFWAPLTPELWLYGIGLGIAGAVGHVFLTHSFAVADASIVLPFDYTRLPFAALIGYIAFGNLADLETWIGAALIAAAAFYVARREQKLARQ